jgi:hypothetical protein
MFNRMNYEDDQDKRRRHFWEIYHTLDGGSYHTFLSMSWKLFDPGQKIYFSRSDIADKFRTALDELCTQFSFSTIEYNLPIIHDAIFEAKDVRSSYTRNAMRSRSTRIKLDVWIDGITAKYLFLKSASESRKKLEANPFDPDSDIFKAFSGV